MPIGAGRINVIQVSGRETYKNFVMFDSQENLFHKVEFMEKFRCSCSKEIQDDGLYSCEHINHLWLKVKEMTIKGVKDFVKSNDAEFIDTFIGQLELSASLYQRGPASKAALGWEGKVKTTDFVSRVMQLESDRYSVVERGTEILSIVTERQEYRNLLNRRLLSDFECNCGSNSNNCLHIRAVRTAFQDWINNGYMKSDGDLSEIPTGAIGGYPTYQTYPITVERRIEGEITDWKLYEKANLAISEEYQKSLDQELRKSLLKVLEGNNRIVPTMIAIDKASLNAEEASKNLLEAAEKMKEKPKHEKPRNIFTEFEL